MTYTKTQDGQVTKFPYTIGDLHKDNPQTSFPRRIPDEMLASYEVFEVVVGAAPSIDETTYRAVRADTPTYAGDKWHLEWSVVEKTPEEKQIITMHPLQELEPNATDCCKTPTGWP